jgi:hypothetical protein
MATERALVVPGQSIIRAVFKEPQEPPGSPSAVLYAPDEESAQRFLVGEDWDAWTDMVYQLIVEGSFYDLSEFAENFDRVFRIDDRRPGHSRSYMVSLNTGDSKYDLLPRTVYHCYGGSEPEAGERLTDFDKVVALMDEPGTLHIDDLGEFAGGSRRDERLKAVWDFDNRVTVFDIGSIYRAQYGVPENQAQNV